MGGNHNFNPFKRRGLSFQLSFFRGYDKLPGSNLRGRFMTPTQTMHFYFQEFPQNCHILTACLIPPKKEFHPLYTLNSLVFFLCSPVFQKRYHLHPRHNSKSFSQCCESDEELSRLDLSSWLRPVSQVS